MSSHLMPKSLLYKSLNILLFYIGWLYVISTATSNHPYQGIFATFCILIFHFVMTKNWLKELLVISSVCLIGFSLDTLYASLGLLRYASPNPLSPSLAPLWIIALYALFGTTLNSSLSWLRHQPILGMIFGAVGGSLSYFFSIRLGAAEYGASEATVLSLIAFAWFLLIPILFAVSRFFERSLSVR